jgi:hypothetical protein
VQNLLTLVVKFTAQLIAPQQFLESFRPNKKPGTLAGFFIS